MYRRHNGFLLTERERKLLELVAEGWTDKRIASYKNISHQTVRNSMRIIKEKLGTRNRIHSVITAIRRREIFVT